MASALAERTPHPSPANFVRRHPLPQGEREGRHSFRENGNTRIGIKHVERAFVVLVLHNVGEPGSAQAQHGDLAFDLGGDIQR